MSKNVGVYDCYSLIILIVRDRCLLTYRTTLFFKLKNNSFLVNIIFKFTLKKFYKAIFFDILLFYNVSIFCLSLAYFINNLKTDYSKIDLSYSFQKLTVSIFIHVRDY